MTTVTSIKQDPAEAAKQALKFALQNARVDEQIREATRAGNLAAATNMANTARLSLASAIAQHVQASPILQTAMQNHASNQADYESCKGSYSYQGIFGCVDGDRKQLISAVEKFLSGF